MARNLVPSNEPPAHMAPASPNLPVAAADFSPVPVEEGSEGFQWHRYVSALRRYKWLILLITVLGTGIGVVATRFLTPQYDVQATIWIESPPARDGPIRAQGLLESYAWVELLKTYTVLDSVVQKERLYLSHDPADSLAFKKFALMDRFRPGAYVLTVDRAHKSLTLKTKEGLLVQSAAVGDSIGQRVGLAWQPDPSTLKAGRSYEFGVVTPRDASQALSGQLGTQMAQDGNFLRLQLTGSDPVRLTNTMNALADQFVAVAADLKKRKLTELSRILAEQVASVGQQLRDAETRLESYKVQTITQPNDATPINPGVSTSSGTVIGEYFSQKVQADALKRDRENIERVLRESQSGSVPIDAFQTIPSVRTAPDFTRALAELADAEAQLRALKFKYTDEYKPVKDLEDRIATLRTQIIPSYANTLISALRAQQADLEGRIGAQSHELQQIPNRMINEARLDREVKSMQSIYTDLQARYEQAQLAEASAIPDVRILDPAVQPESPSRNDAPRLIFLAFMGSMGAAVALALLLDRLDKRFRYPDQVTNELGLSILGAVPAINKLKHGGVDLEETAQVVEAFRGIRLNIVHSYGAAGPVMLTISSPSPGDGKSLVSSNLALSFAEAGYKTLLIDGDIRRGELHRMFRAERIPGLLDYLMKSATLEQVLRPTSKRNLTLLPCGTRRQHGPELLGSALMNELMATLKTRYNVIIVDSPPLGAGIDPFVLGTATGNMVLVLRSGETNREMAEAKLKVLDRLPIRILGAVLNDIRAGGVYQYYGYVYGYVADEDKPEQLPAGSGDAAPTS
ncbi:MAG TPA: polysaccharide biosynthesis tyrosine autokinase [Gemmatimonadales bacterium]